MNYVRKLAFEETPDYDYLRGLMDKVLKNIDCEDDGIYDWVYVIDKRRKEKEKEKERRNDLIYPQNISSNKNLFNSKIQQFQHSIKYHSNYNSQDIHKSTKSRIIDSNSMKQPLPIQMQIQNNQLRNSTNIYNSRNSRKFQSYKQMEKISRSKSYDRYKYDDNNLRYTDKEEYAKLMASDTDLKMDQKIIKYEYNIDNQRINKQKLKNKNTEETEKVSCFKHMFLCCFK